MKLLYFEPELCEACPYSENRTQVVADEVGDGYGAGGIMVVGEAPGYNEDKQGRPFVGDSGKYLDALLELSGIKHSDCYITNICRCRPPNNKITAKGIKFHRPFFEAALREAKPAMVIAVGATALSYFRSKPKLTACHGRPFVWTDSGSNPVVVFPTFHPAYAMKNGSIWPLLYNDFLSLGSPNELEVVEAKYKLGTDEEAAEIMRRYGVVGFDIETTDTLHEGVFYPHLQRCLGYSVSWAPGESMYVPNFPGPTIADILQGDVVKVCHNAKFEYQVLLNHGIELRSFEDTKLKAYLLQYPTTHLKDLSMQVLGVQQLQLEDVRKGRPTSEVTPEEWLPYAAADADVTLRLNAVFDKRLREEGLEELYRRFELPLVNILARAERRGIQIDGLGLVADRLRGKLGIVEGQIREIIDVVNLNSKQQVAAALQAVGVRLTEKTPTGRPKLNKAAVAGLRHPVIPLLQTYWQTRDYLNDFVEKLPRIAVDGVLHTSINQAGTWEERGDKTRESPVTGRLSSSGPNLMQIPKRDAALAREIRSCFKARPGYVLMSADISQEEARLMAVVSGDGRMQEEFSGDADVYVPIAAAIKGGPLVSAHEVAEYGIEYRHVAKTAFLARQYLGGPRKLVETFPGLTMSTAYDIMRRFDSTYPGVAAFHRRIEGEVTKTGFSTTLFGRKRWLPGIWQRQTKQEALRQAVNMPIQGTAADILKGSILWLVERLGGLDAYFLFPVHDEVVLEVREECVREVQSIVGKMTEWVEFCRLPVEVKIGKTWAM